FGVEPRTARQVSMTYDHIRVTALATSVGAEISAVDLATPPGASELSEVRRALGEYGVVFFRDQRLSPERHIAFARCFGEIDVNRFFAGAGLSDDRRGAQGAGAAAQYRQWLAYRPLL